jgi:hypothetical protein
LLRGIFWSLGTIRCRCGEIGKGGMRCGKKAGKSDRGKDRAEYVTSPVQAELNRAGFAGGCLV